MPRTRNSYLYIITYDGIVLDHPKYDLIMLISCWGYNLDLNPGLTFDVEWMSCSLPLPVWEDFVDFEQQPRKREARGYVSPIAPKATGR